MLGIRQLKALLTHAQIILYNYTCVGFTENRRRQEERSISTNTLKQERELSTKYYARVKSDRFSPKPISVLSALNRGLEAEVHFLIDIRFVALRYAGIPVRNRD